MIKIKVSIPGFGGNLNISQYVGNDDGVWGDARFYVNDSSVDEVDYWFVIDDLWHSVEEVRVDPRCVCYVNAEVVYENGYFDVYYRARFLDQFARIMSCHDIYRPNSESDIPFLGWMINAGHGPSIFSAHKRGLHWLMSLSEVEKKNKISVFCSNKTITSDHKLRLKFVQEIKSYFGDALDWYGNGINPVNEKWDGIAPYKYHIVLENKVASNVITEKIYDSYLGLSYPFYWGAPNLGDYFSRGSFEPINIRDLKGTINQIEAAIQGDYWGTNYSQILESKARVLSDYNPYARMARIANQNISGCGSLEQRRVILYDKKRVAMRDGRSFISAINALVGSMCCSLFGRIDL